MNRSRAPLLASLVLLLIALLSVLPSPGRAQTADHVVISEVMIHPLGTQPDREWIEVFNPSTATIALMGFSWVMKRPRGAEKVCSDSPMTLPLRQGEY